EIMEVARVEPSHAFLRNPASHLVFIYLTRFVEALSQNLLQRPFSSLSVLDWGCGKGHVSKLLRDLGPKVESCDIAADRDDSAFGQKIPIVQKWHIPVTSLHHEYELPYDDATFDVVLSVGVLEHVRNDRASVAEIARVLKPGGLFYCFNLPATLSWTQKVSHLRKDFYHDRLYDEGLISNLLRPTGLSVIDLWHRQILPKNSVHYPFFRWFETVDQMITFYTPFCVFATSIEFVSQKAKTA
ncbi:MAG TPA: class I SAM-dependent methyltransferase, partial [Acidobacteriaceae bacterium]|nr:class I SAM-dependent methyltransferase [Acidobacteriaceae bacterium]